MVSHAVSKESYLPVAAYGTYIIKVLLTLEIKYEEKHYLEFAIYKDFEHTAN